MYTLYLTICIIVVISATIHLKNKHLRVHYGEDIKEGDYPYAVSLFKIYKDNDGYRVHRLCTASVIAEQWILTAAHCVYGQRAHKVGVWYANFTFSPLATNLYTAVLKIFTHQSYRYIFHEKNIIIDNDISLLRIHKITLKTYGRLSAMDHTTMIGLPVTYVGGGGTIKTGDDELRPLQVGEAMVTTCDTTMKESGKYIICISPKCSNTLGRPWFGDSGGPLVHDGKIIGVCSHGTEGDIVMDAYAPTSPYIEWLYGVMHSEE